MSLETMRQLVTDFGATIEIPNLALDEDGFCCLAFDDIVVDIQYDEQTDAVTLYSRVGDLPVDPPVTLYALLLEANFRFRGTIGAALGIDRIAGSIALSYRWPAAALDRIQFEAMLEDFTNAAEFWSGSLAQPIADKDSADGLPPPSGGIRV